MKMVLTALTREWYAGLSDNFQARVWIVYPLETVLTYMPYSDSKVNENHLQYFLLVGQLLESLN